MNPRSVLRAGDPQSPRFSATLAPTRLAGRGEPRVAQQKSGRDARAPEVSTPALRSLVPGRLPTFLLRLLNCPPFRNSKFENRKSKIGKTLSHCRFDVHQPSPARANNLCRFDLAPRNFPWPSSFLISHFCFLIFAFPFSSFPTRGPEKSPTLRPA